MGKRSGRVLDTGRYHIGVCLAPRSRRRVIEIMEGPNPERVWHLTNQQQILQWLQWYCSFPLEQQLALMES